MAFDTRSSKLLAVIGDEVSKGGCRVHGAGVRVEGEILQTCVCLFPTMHTHTTLWTTGHVHGVPPGRDR